MAQQPNPPESSGNLTRLDERRWAAAAASGSGHIDFFLHPGPVFVLDRDNNGQRYILPGDASPPADDKIPQAADNATKATYLEGSGLCWVLPDSPFSSDAAWMIEAGSAAASVTATFDTPSRSSTRIKVTVHSHSATLTSHKARPHSDVLGAAYTLSFPGGHLLADALAGFYWGTILPCVIERTSAATYPDSVGFVVSTLAGKYAGTYPDVDHEFQIKGRLAAGSALDVDVVRRMMELQFRMMREDPCNLWRDPCAVQPSGDREYHVRRNSMDGRENAVMFLITGNVEVVESVWLYVARTGNVKWLRRHLEDLEGALSCVEGCIDPLGRLWSDVYYEDQVIKDGRETLAAALALHSFELMDEIEQLLDRPVKAAHYKTLADRLRKTLAEPLPVGYWDAEKHRFTDWVDRSGVAHDHMHLLANELPVLFGAATPAQTSHVDALLDREEREFQRFPSFLAARIQDYTCGEIGDGGPYDLCAAGRYWCWDAAFWSARGRGDILADQLRRVAKMGRRDDWVMGERYDMNHVHYVDGPPWHGAAHYYEYPCVFAWVLMHEYLGVRFGLSLAGDGAMPGLRIAPRLVEGGTVVLEQEAYQLKYEYHPSGTSKGSFVLHNLASTSRKFTLDLGVLFPDAKGFVFVNLCQKDDFATFDGGPVLLGPRSCITICPT